MSWLDPHKRSEELASQAAQLVRKGEVDNAVPLYAKAAELEELALDQVGSGTPRTLGIIAISTASLWFKARELRRAEAVALRVLAAAGVPDFARSDLRIIVQTVWTEDTKRHAGVKFLPGQVMVSVKGGEVVQGGAPLDLVVEKVQGIQSLFYRTIEFVLDRPLRTRGSPVKDVQDLCRPWLFQAAPGSYQFSVAVQEPPQSDLFRKIEPAKVVDSFLQIVQASSEESPDRLVQQVPDAAYRRAFLKITRNLAPTTTGRAFTELEIRTADDHARVTLRQESRTNINGILRTANEPTASPSEVEETLKGVLRAVHLDQDWLDVVLADGTSVHVKGLGDSLDDVVGPMVNRPVSVRTARQNEQHRLIDIEIDE